MKARVALLCLAMLGLAACNSGPRRSDDAVDPSVYNRPQGTETEAAWQRARASLAKGDDRAALPDLIAVTKSSPQLVRAHLAYQDVARRLGGPVQQTMQDFYLGMPDGKLPVAAYYRARLADTSYAQSNALAAILRQDPSFAWAHLSLARVTRRQGRLAPALDMYAAAIVNDSTLHEARHERAQVLAELGRDAEAANDYKAYLAQRPDDLDATRDYATLLLYRLGRTNEAQPLLKLLEQRFPADVTIQMDQAAALWRAQQPRESAAAYLAILEKMPTNSRAALNLGLLYFEVLPKDDADRRRFWPRARAAFRWFLDGREPVDGHEQFERTLGVPFRMRQIATLLGPEPLHAVRLEDMRWPNG